MVSIASSPPRTSANQHVSKLNRGQAHIRGERRFLKNKTLFDRRKFIEGPRIMSTANRILVINIQSLRRWNKYAAPWIHPG
jgi:hypothetical protein